MAVDRRNMAREGGREGYGVTGKGGRGCSENKAALGFDKHARKGGDAGGIWFDCLKEQKRVSFSKKFPKRSYICT